MQKTNVLIFGSSGSGKSSSIATVFKLLPKFPNLKVRYLCTEANALSGMSEGIRRHNITLQPGQLAYMICRPTASKLESSKTVAENFEKNFLRLSEKDALAVKIGSGDRANQQTFLEILKGLATFKGIDYVSKETHDYGDYLKWDNDTILVIDSLTACVDYLVQAVKGPRIATVQSDYNFVQTNLMSKIIIPLTEQAQCSIVMLGHPVIGEDTTVKQPKEEEQKIMKLYPKTFGQALNDTIVSKFTETIFAYVTRQDKFVWAGRKEGVATSPRALPRKDELEPDFSLYNIFQPD